MKVGNHTVLLEMKNKVIIIKYYQVFDLNYETFLPTNLTKILNGESINTKQILGN